MKTKLENKFRKLTAQYLLEVNRLFAYVPKKKKKRVPIISIDAIKRNLKLKETKEKCALCLGTCWATGKGLDATRPEQGLRKFLYKPTSHICSDCFMNLGRTFIKYGFQNK